MKLRKRGHCKIKQRTTGVWRQINRFSVLFQKEIEQYNFEESETFWYKLAYNINLTVPCKNKHRCTYCKIQDLSFTLEWTVLIDKTQLHLAMLKKPLNFNFCWKSYISTFQLRVALAQVKKKKVLCPPGWWFNPQLIHLAYWSVLGHYTKAKNCTYVTGVCVTKKWTLCLALCDCVL